jgi:hypothetical protein
MSKEPQPFLRRSTRVYIYSIVVATAPLLAAGGMVTEGVAQLGLQLAAAILAVTGGSLALKNVSGN